MFYPPVGLMFVRAPAPACGMAPLEVCFKTAVKEEMAQLGAAGRCNGATVLSATIGPYLSLDWTTRKNKKELQ